MGKETVSGDKHDQLRALDHDIQSCKNGDWEAKARIFKQFMPLLLSLAKKRTSDNATINRYVEAGKNGLLHAANKYKPSVGADRFQIFALDFIEAAMNKAEPGKGFFARLFGR
jgi:DNA-directed RNA polymerase specialized sigma subunit